MRLGVVLLRMRMRWLTFWALQSLGGLHIWRGVDHVLLSLLSMEATGKRWRLPEGIDQRLKLAGGEDDV